MSERDNVRLSPSRKSRRQRDAEQKLEEMVKDVPLDISRNHKGLEGKDDSYQVGGFNVTLKELYLEIGKEKAKIIKCYIHEVSGGDRTGCSFSVVHSDSPQDGIKIDQSSFKGVSVYYFYHDLYNATPLLLKVEQSKTEYYQPDVKSNEWKISGVTESSLTSKFGKFTKHIKTFPVVLNTSLSGKYNIYGYEKDYSVSLKLPALTVEDDETHTIQGYVKTTHKITRDYKTYSMKVVSTRNKTDYISFKDPETYNKEYSSVSIYYWKDDESRAHPLLLVLGEDYYACKGSYWKKVSMGQGVIADEQAQVRKVLDEINCEINRVVQIDISEPTDSSGPTQHYCHNHAHDEQLTHTSKRIQVSPDLATISKGHYSALHSHGYSVYEHTLISVGGGAPIISAFKNGGNDIKLNGLTPGLPVMEAEKVIVFMCQRGSNKAPLLIHIKAPKLDTPGKQWFQSLDQGVSWQVLEHTEVPGCDAECGKILTILEKLCIPPSIAIDIQPQSKVFSFINPPQNHFQYIVKAKLVDCTTDYKVFTHTVKTNNCRDYFTVTKASYYNNNIDKFGTSNLPMDKVKAFSVYYRGHYPGKTRPLLIKVEKHATDPNHRTEWFENTDSTSLKWEPVKDPSGFYDGTGATDKLKERLALLNSLLNGVVQIKVTETTGYCHTVHSDKPRIKVQEVSGSSDKLINYKAYEHTLDGAIQKFTISGFTKGGESLTGLTPELPIKDVSKVTIFVCECPRGVNTPLLIYIDAQTLKTPSPNKQWYKNKDSTWEKVEKAPQGPTSYDDILNILDKLTSGCAPPSVTIDITERRANGEESYYKDPPQGDKQKIIDVIPANPPAINGFTEYKHTVKHWGGYFNVDSFNCNGQPVEGGLAGTDRVMSISVFYWWYAGRPLLIKIEKLDTNGGTDVKWYENAGDPGDKNWNSVTEPSHPTELSNDNGNTNPGGPNVGTVTSITVDIAKTDGSPYPCSSSCKYINMDTEGFSGWIKYIHKLEEKFNISAFKNGDKTLNELPPFINVSQVCVYYKNNKAMWIKVEHAGRKVTWFKMDGTWTELTESEYHQRPDEQSSSQSEGTLETLSGDENSISYRTKEDELLGFVSGRYPDEEDPNSIIYRVKEDARYGDASDRKLHEKVLHKHRIKARTRGGTVGESGERAEQTNGATENHALKTFMENIAGIGVYGSAMAGIFGLYVTQKILEVALERTIELACKVFPVNFNTQGHGQQEGTEEGGVGSGVPGHTSSSGSGADSGSTDHSGTQSSEGSELEPCDEDIPDGDSSDHVTGTESEAGGGGSSGAPPGSGEAGTTHNGAGTIPKSETEEIPKIPSEGSNPPDTIAIATGTVSGSIGISLLGLEIYAFSVNSSRSVIRSIIAIFTRRT